MTRSRWILLALILCAGAGGADSDTEDATAEDPPHTVTRVREPRKSARARSGRDDDDGVRSPKGSTRLEAK